MSQRTIVEFNHDFGDRIRNDPERFLSAIQTLINSGVNDNDSEVKIVLESFGVTTSPTRHHSEDATLILSGREYLF